jgi:hypothetical protein
MEEAKHSKPRQRADAALARLLESNPGYSVDEDSPDWLFGTNFVRFGAFEGWPVVFKYFDWRPRKDQEEKALRLFAPTGLVPKLYPASEEAILVMDRLPGLPLYQMEKTLTQEEQKEVWRQVGRALAQMVSAAPGNPASGRSEPSTRMGIDYQFYCQSDVGTLFDTVIERAANILCEQDVPDKAVLDALLSALRSQRNAIVSYPAFVQMDDINVANIIADGSRVTGFVDLEMTRYGNEVLLLGAAIAMAVREWPERWRRMRRGYEEGRGRAIDDELLRLAGIAAPFSQWIRFMWYWTGSGEFEKGARNQPIRDIKKVTETLDGMKL